MTKKTVVPITQPTTRSAARVVLRLSDLRLGPAWEEWLCTRFDDKSLAEMVYELIAVGFWHELSRRLAEAERIGDVRAVRLMRVERHCVKEQAGASRARRAARRRPSDPRKGSVELVETRLSAEATRWLHARLKHDGGLAATLRSIVFELALVELLTEDYDDEAALRHRLLSAGRTWTQVRRAAAAWRRGERVAGVIIGQPLAARMLDRGLFTRVPQLQRQSRTQRGRA